MRIPATKWHPIKRSWHGTRGQPRRAVIHTIQGSAESALSWFASAENPYGTGAHLVIGPDKAYQTADFETILWHCIGANTDGVGIELDGFAEWKWKDWKKRRRQRKMAANRVGWLCYVYGWGKPTRGVSVFGHGDVPGNDHTDPGRGFPWNRFIRDARRAYNRLRKTRGKEWQ